MYKLPFMLTALAALTLTACGESSDNSSIDDDTGGEQPVEVSIVANSDSAVAINRQSVDIEVTDNDSYDGSGSLSLSIVDYEEADGKLAVDDLLVTFTPADDFGGETSFVYELTDGQHSSTAEVTVTSAQQLTISGQVTDAPIANATVVVQYLDNEFVTVTDEYGQYDIEILFAGEASDEVIRLSARGSQANDQEYVTLSSILGDFNQLMTQAGEDFTLQRNDNNAVQVTQVSTAIDILTHANTDGGLTLANLTDAEAGINPDLMIEMAGVIKLLVDNANYQLPEGFDTIEQFLKNPDAYNAVVATASETGDLAEAIAATLADPDVRPTLTADQFAGNYFLALSGNSVIGYTSRESWLINNDGTVDIMRASWPNYTSATVDWRLDDNKLELGSYTYINTSSGISNQVLNALDDIDYEYTDQLMSFVSGLDTFDFVQRVELEDAVIIGQTTTGFNIRFRQSFWYESFEFEQDGQTYTVPEVKVSEYARNTQLVTHSNIQRHDGRFDINETTPWVLPVIATAKADQSTLASSDFITFDFDSQTSGAFYGTLSNAQGSWALESDGSTLVLNYPLGNQDITTTLDVASFSDINTSAFVNHTVKGSGELDFGSLTYLHRVAPYTPMSNELLTHADDEFFARLLSVRPTVWNNHTLPKENMVHNWYFRSDGAVSSVLFYCDGERTYTLAACANDEIDADLSPGSGKYVWELDGSESLHLKPADNSRTVAVYSAIDLDEIYQIMNIVEYWPSLRLDVPQEELPLALWPRIKPWARISHIDFLSGSEIEDGSSSYRIMRPTQHTQEQGNQI